MNNTLVNFLNTCHADRVTICLAAKYALAERTDYLSPEEMKERLVTAVGNSVSVDEVAKSLEGDPVALEAASLALLSSLWQLGHQEQVRHAIDEAPKKLPVLETAIIAICAMYAMYLWKTGGISKSYNSVERMPDGTFREVKTTEYFSSTGPLSAIVHLFNRPDPTQEGRSGGS